MTHSEMREKLLELAEWHMSNGLRLHFVGHEWSWHKEQAALLRQVAETMEDGVEPECIFSGDYSRDMWAAINALDGMSTGDQVRDVLYLIGCRLQEFESRALAARPKEKE